MLTIKNINKIVHKTLGKKNFYVERVQESLIYNPATFEPEGKYLIEITNRRYAISITLNRKGYDLHNQTYYSLHSSTGKVYDISFLELCNMDKFIDKLRYVGLG